MHPSSCAGIEGEYADDRLGGNVPTDKQNPAQKGHFLRREVPSFVSAPRVVCVTHTGEVSTQS
jgi:hypothetical protein